jgi:hypothetical protein
MAAVLSAILGLYFAHTQSLDAVSTEMARREMQRLLAPAGLELVWNQGDREVARAIVATFDDSCSVDTLPAQSSGDAAAIALAESSVSSSGRVLPYFHVNCSRLIQTLTPALQPLNLPLRRVVFGRALGRVMAHEVYHILSQRKDHDPTGVAKASFTLEDLTARQFEFEFPLMARAH